jgi:hypothetical protein
MISAAQLTKRFEALSTRQKNVVIGTTIGVGVGLVFIVGNITGRAESKPKPDTKPTADKATPPATARSSTPAAFGASLTVTTPRNEPGRLRAKPSLRATILAYIAAGTKVEVMSTSSPDDQRWYQVKTPKGVGWMHSDILQDT